MHDNSDDDFDQPAQGRTPALPRELRERLFTYADGAPAIRYDAIGPEKWPAAVQYGAKQGFTVWRNPLTSDQRAYFHLGPNEQLMVGFEMGLIPAQFRIPRALADERLRLGLLLRPEYCRLFVRIPAGGTLAVPSIFDSAIRTLSHKAEFTNDPCGIVIGGQMPHLLIDGEKDPPPIHACLLPMADSEGPMPSGGAAARRRT